MEVNDLEDEEDGDEIFMSQVVELPEEEAGTRESEPRDGEISIRRVKCSRSPVLYMYYQQFSCRCLVDTGGQSSLISQMFVQQAGIKMSRPTQGATQLDKTPGSILRGE